MNNNNDQRLPAPDEMTLVQRIYVNLCTSRQCVWCKKVFDEGIIQKMPKQHKSHSPYEWFTAEFLFHSQTTHGYTPDIISDFIETLKKHEKPHTCY